ncbi:MAG: hypothetical protein HY954_10540 [Deltaproteobacteria bacterium]|nr:hypothetical protein [Deltaproteobacteria bacterium]
MYKYLFLLLVLAFSGLSYGAEGDSVARATEIVTDFHTESQTLLKGVALDGSETSIDRKEKALSELKGLSWSQGPGKRRFMNVYDIVDSYTNDVIRSVEDLKAKAAEPKLDRILNQLVSYREAKLKELEESLRIEAPEKETRPPVPSVDGSPFDEVPGEGPDIWFR